MKRLHGFPTVFTQEVDYAVGRWCVELTLYGKRIDRAPYLAIAFIVALVSDQENKTNISGLGVVFFHPFPHMVLVTFKTRLFDIADKP